MEFSNHLLLPTKQSKDSSPKESQEKYSMEINIILEGLPDDVIEKIGQCVSSKELWDKIKDLYSYENPNGAYQSE